MRRWNATRRTVAAAMVACLLSFTLAQAKKPDNPGGEGGGGGGGGLVNPAYVVMDGDNISRLKLLSFDGLEDQEIVKAKAFRGMQAPTWSPDGQWIAYKKGEDDGRSLRMIHPDGSGEQTIYFENGPILEQIHGMQWVPGEVNRIIYCVPTSGSVYSISTQDPFPTPRLILSNSYWLSGVTLSPDLKPEIFGYQGAMAFVGPRGGVFGEPNLLSVAFVEDGEEGLEVDLSSLVQATTLTDGVATPAWSHDGLEIAFLYYNTTYPDAGNSLEVMPVNVGETEINLLEDDARTIYDSSLVDVYGSDHSVVHRPSWSPDDSMIGFCATVGIEPGGGRSYDLFVATSDGSGAVNVTNGSMRPKYMDWKPTWIPDVN